MKKKGDEVVEGEAGARCYVKRGKEERDGVSRSRGEYSVEQEGCKMKEET